MNNKTGNEHPQGGRAVADAIDRLPEREKLIASLLWYESCELDQAAEALGISVEEAGDLEARAAESVRSAIPPSPDRQHHLAAWPTRAELDAECSRDWSRYDSGLAEHYAAYFERHPELRGAQRHSARDLASALPSGWERLAEEIPASARHRHHLSGKSSQTLALGLLGVAKERDPSLAWLWEAAEPLPGPGDPEPRLAIEHTVERNLLDEHPRRTALDALVEDSKVVICVEAKLREGGLGSCSCGRDGGDPLTGGCAERVLDRAAYWDAARDVYGLPDRDPPLPCPISVAYQAVRNAAAALALAGPDRLAVFLLLYDERNPYFRQTGDWPGWPALLEATVSGSADPERFRFRSVSWQDLLPCLPLDDTTREWADEKHGLVRS